MQIPTVTGILALLLSVTASAAPSPASLPRLIVALNTDIRSTNPGVNRDSNTDAVLHHMVESLVGYGEDMSIQPVVAASWQVGDEGREWTFTLREGLRFHNGEPVTAAEVLWSWQRYLDPETRWQCRRWFAGNDDEGSDGKASVITDIAAPDARTVVFRLQEASTLFLHRMANTQCISAVLHPDSLDAAGEWREPVATGPYRFAEWRHGEYIELQRFDDYTPHGERIDGLAGRKIAYAKRLRFLVSPDAAGTKAALLAGQVDVFPGVPMNGIEEFERAKDTYVLQSPTLGWSVLLLQTRDPLLQDVRIRKAIAYAIDRRMVADFNTYGYASVNSSAVPVGVSSHTGMHDRWYEADVKKARALLKEAGYDGEPVRIQANRKYRNMYANAVVIQAMLHAAGMNAHIEVLDWAGHLSNYFAGKFQLSTFSFSALATPDLRYIKLIGSKDKRPVYQWDSEPAARLIETLTQTFAEDTRQHLYDALHQQMIDEVPIIGLYNAHAATALGKDVRDFQPWPLNLPRLWGVWKADDAG
jgi:peptide/nickel transport system substrate-binding protein